MKGLKRCFSLLIAAGTLFIMSACGTKPTETNLSGNIQTESGTVAATLPPAATAPPVTAEIPSETAFEITKSDLMKLIWWEDELADVGKVIYPGFELDCEIEDGKYYRVFRSGDKKIEILENVTGVEEKYPVSRGELIIRNSETSKRYSVWWGIGNINNHDTSTRREKKVFFQDLTNDGREELIINLPVFDMVSSENDLFVFDALNLETIEFPEWKVLCDKLEGALKAEIKEVKDDGLLTVDITIDGKTYEAYTHVFEGWHAEDMRYRVGVRGYYVGENGVYYRAFLNVYHKDYYWTMNDGVIPIDIPLAYNPELNAFEAVEGEYIVNNLR